MQTKKTLSVGIFFKNNYIIFTCIYIYILKFGPNYNNIQLIVKYIYIYIYFTNLHKI